jgi:hypothetical protein
VFLTQLNIVVKVQCNANFRNREQVQAHHSRDNLRQVYKGGITQGHSVCESEIKSLRQVLGRLRDFA